MPYVGNIALEASHNIDLCRVLATGMHAQVEVICLRQGEELAPEQLHHDCVIVALEGHGELNVDGRIHHLGHNDLVLIDSGSTRALANHEIEPLKAYTIYTSHVHANAAVFKTEADEAHGGTF